MTVHTPIEVRSRAIPPWAIGLTVLVFLVGGVYLAGSGDVTQQARRIIDSAQPSCTACHGADLTGGVGPDLHGLAEGPKSANLQDLAAEHPDDWPILWITGTGPEVEGLDRGGMPAYGESLSPEEIATVVEYLKTLQ
jgi:mono/diheme cytochrome c family protein